MTTPNTEKKTPIDTPETKRTIAHLLLDSSGSMAEGIEETIQAFNGYIRGLNDDEETAKFIMSVSHFNSLAGVTTLAEDVPPGDVSFLDRDNYVPNGGTPLYDAIAEVIDRAERTSKTGDNVMVVIQTDGHENASKKWTHESIKSWIMQKQAHGWEFIYLAKGLDAMDAGAKIGINVAQTISYDSETSGMATQSLGARSARYARGGSTSSATGKTEDLRS